MATTLAQLAELVGGQVLGGGDVEIHGAATLADAQAGDITLIDDADKAPRLCTLPIAAVVAPQGVAIEHLPVLEVEDVHTAFTAIVRHFRPARQLSRIGISPAAQIAASAQLAADVDVYPQTTIGDDVAIGTGSTIHAGVHIMPGCRVGRQVTIMPGAVLYEDTQVGDRVVIHAGAVIGGFGFGYSQVDGRHVIGAQLGHVEIGDDVEIGANTTIDRGTYGPTKIGSGTKIDNLVMIGHNCRIGRHNMICSQVGIAGSTTTGDYVVMGGQVGVRDHVHIGTQAVLAAKAGVSNDVADGMHVIGIPAKPARDQRLQFAAVSKLPGMRKEFRDLNKQLKSLQQQVDQLAEQGETLLEPAAPIAAKASK